MKMPKTIHASASTVAHPAIIHPGEILLTEFMEPLGLTAYRLAKDLDVPAPRVGDLVRGKRSLSADTALRLGIYFGLPAQFWLNLQNEFDLRKVAATPASRTALARIKRKAA
jgi:antitoxin HigA-1